MSCSSLLSTSSSLTMIKKSVSFYSSKFHHLPHKIRPTTHVKSPGRILCTHDPSDPADFPGKTPSEYPDGGPSYRPVYPVEVPELPNDPDLEPVGPPEIISDPPPTSPGQNPGPDFPVPPSAPPPKPESPMPPPDWLPPPPGGPSPTPVPPAGPGVVF